LIFTRRRTGSATTPRLGGSCGPGHPSKRSHGHCRANLLGFSRRIAQRFTSLWEQAAGMTYHPWIGVVTVMDFLDDLQDDWG
jgi:hypothetical protein